MLQLSRQDIELISRRLLSEYLKKQITRIDKIDPVDFAEKCAAFDLLLRT